MDDVVNRFARELAGRDRRCGRRKSSSGSMPREGTRGRIRNESHARSGGRIRQPLTDRRPDKVAAPARVVQQSARWM